MQNACLAQSAEHAKKTTARAEQESTFIHAVLLNYCTAFLLFVDE